MLDKQLTIEIARVTENGAIAAASLRGRGDEQKADELAIKAVADALGDIDIDGTVVIGEGETEAEAPLLYVGQKLGTGKGTAVDVATDALEGATLVAKSSANALCVVAVAEPGSLLKTPPVYMEKIAVGGDLPDGVVDLDASPVDNLKNLAKAKGVDVADLTVCILDRPRHAQLIAEVRKAGAAINLISDGDIAGVIHAANTHDTGIDIYMGSGGAREGVLAAAALACIGGQMYARFMVNNRSVTDQLARFGIDDPDRIFGVKDMASGDVIFSATGITSGSLLKGVRFGTNHVSCQTLLLRAHTGSVRWLTARRRLARA